MSNPRISGDEMLCLFALGAFTGLGILSLVLAACGGFWVAAQASLVAVVVVLAETARFGRDILGRGRPVPARETAKEGGR